MASTRTCVRGTMATTGARNRTKSAKQNLKFNRRDFLKVAAGSALSATLLSTLSSCGKSSFPKPDKPMNVLWIIIDDQRGDCVSYLPDSYPGVKTPNLDRIARHGMVFNNAHCTTAACLPSRVSMLTGLFADQTGFYSNDDHTELKVNDRKEVVIPGITTVSQHFNRHGYDVRFGGKVFHAYKIQKEAWGVKECFVPRRPKWPDPPIQEIARQEKEEKDPKYFEFDWGVVDWPEETMEDSQTARWAAEKLSQQYKEPFFLAVGLKGPHAPFYLPQRYIDMFPADKVVLPPVPEDDW